MVTSYFRKILEKRHYNNGRIVMALQELGPLAGPELARICGMKPNGIHARIKHIPNVKCDISPYEWHYKRNGKTHIIKREVWQYSIIEEEFAHV